MSSTREFDYIIAGAGCAGLTLVARMLANERLASRTILIIDRDTKDQNDRTWCFWEKEPGFFDSIVHQSWDTLDFHGQAVSRNLDIRPYRYKMIRSIDFYEYCRKIISSYRNVRMLTGNIDSLTSTSTGVTAVIDGTEYKGRLGFNSTLKGIDIDPSKHILLRQHFKGWLIQTSEKIFDPAVATLMDFRIPQTDGTSFFYVLPVAPDRALVEYTLFTKELLKPELYNERLSHYIRQWITNQSYQVIEEEQGVIPMTNFQFRISDGNIFNIGTAGGQTKGSTGYTFQFIQKHAAQIVDSLSHGDHPPTIRSVASWKFSLYDAVMLRVLNEKKYSGADLFSKIFSTGDPISILRFLDNESKLREDLAIMNRLPKRTFGAAAIKEVISRIGIRD